MGLWIFGDGNNGTAYWEPDPSSGRGTWSIITTCFITLSLCVYTSIHLNIPAEKTTPADLWTLKVKYVAAGLFLPELMAYNAWRQRMVAATIVDYIRKVRGGKPRSSLVQRILGQLRTSTRMVVASLVGESWQHMKWLQEEKGNFSWNDDQDPWASITMQHGFFIGMGGYAFDVSEHYHHHQTRIWPRGTNRLVMHARGVGACLASDDESLRNLIPYLSEKEISDKSKANGLAKALVCIQALWFMIQVVGRLSQGYPISLLELSTFAHALCALIVYCLWWDKPLDIEEPAIIRASMSEVARDVCVMAWTGVQGPVEHFRIEDEILGGFWKTMALKLGRAMGASRAGPLSDAKLLSDTRQFVDTADASTENRIVIISGMEESRSPIPALDTPEFHGLDLEERNARNWVSSAPPCFRLEGGEKVPGTSSTFVSVHWKSIEVDEILYQRIKIVEYLRSTGQWDIYDKALRSVLDIWDKDVTILKPREYNFSDSLMRSSFDTDSRVAGNIYAVAGILASGIIYGGLHMLAWGSSAFNKKYEEILWIFACCTVALGGLFVFFGIWLVDKVIHRGLTIFGIKVSTILLFLAFPIGVAIGVLYAVSRAYLMVEVLRNLAYLDPKIYTTPDWPIYFPHIR